MTAMFSKFRILIIMQIMALLMTKKGTAIAVPLIIADLDIEQEAALLDADEEQLLCFENLKLNIFSSSLFFVVVIIVLFF